MRSNRLPLLLVGLAVFGAILLSSLSFASVDDDILAMQDLERAARQKSLALLAVLKNMGPEFEEGTSTMAMARIVSVTCEVREARGLESRVILNPNLNDEYRVLDQDDTLVRLDLGDGRTGWIDETHLQRFEQETQGNQLSFYGTDSDQLRRYAIVTDDLLAGIDEDRAVADEILDSYQAEDGSLPDTPEMKTLLGAHGMITEYQGYARHFHQKYILNYDFSLKNQRAFLDNLSAWADLLMGKSKFTTTTYLSPTDETKDEIDESLQQISIGGNLEINERSQARASFSNKKQVNQTSYTTNTAMGGYSLDWSESTHLDFSADTYAFADDINTFNDFRRTTLSARSVMDRGDRNYRLGYSNTSQTFEENDVDDFSSHGIDASARWKRGRTGTVTGKVLATLESSDVAFHDFSHITPSLEYAKRSGAGQVRWSGLYEMLEYDDVALRSFARAQLAYEKSSKDGPRRSLSRYAVAHKNFPDNKLATYFQLRTAWNRNKIGPENLRKTLTTRTNFYPDNTDNNYTDVRASRNHSMGTTFRDLTLYTRLWHKPGENDSTSIAKPYVADLYGRYGWIRGNFRFGPTVGVHLIAAKGTKVIERDGNLFRVGFKADGTFALPNKIQLTLDASYDYGFVYSDEFTIDTVGNITAGETVQRHPTTFQINAFGSRPLGHNFDLTSRLTVYRIATDMNPKTSINPVTNNDRFTLFVGVRFRHN